MKKVVLMIEGMHCAACGTNVNKSLLKIGAKDININVVFGKAFVEIDEKIKEEDLKNAVRDAGFKLIKINEY